MEITQLVNFIQDTSNNFINKLPALESEMLKQVLKIISELDNKNGKIKITVKNLKLLNKIKLELNKVVKTKQYTLAVNNVLEAINKISDMQTAYFTKFNVPVDKPLILESKKLSLDSIREGLSGAGLTQNITNQIADNIRQAIVSGMSITNLTQQMTAELTTKTNETVGKLTRYTQLFATDSVNQFAAENNKIIAEKMGADWFMYVGTNLETTRELCKHLTKKKYIHKSEIPNILKGYIDGIRLDINPRTNLPRGMINGTNADNFIIRRGGWNCGHQLVPVPRSVVPQSVRSQIETLA